MSSPSSPTSTPLLWDRVCARDPGAEGEFVALVREVCGRFFRTARLSKADTEELLARVHLKVWQLASDQEAAPDNLEGMLFFKAKGELSSLRRERRGFDLEGQFELTSNTTSPADELLEGERSQAIWDCVDELAPKDRELWLARYRGELAPTRISEMTGLGEATIAGRFFRSKDRLLACLQRKGVVQ